MLRFLLTDDCPDLEAELRRIGHEVVGGPSERVTAACAGTDWHPKRFDIVRAVQAHRPDSCLFVAPLRIVEYEPGKFSEFGYARDQIVKVKGVRNCVTVGVARVGDDPRMSDLYRRGMCPKCVAGPQTFGFWATADEATAMDEARQRRTALWRPGEGGAVGLVALVEAAMRREQHRGGKDARPHLPA